jgi:hypothetical protein
MKAKLLILALLYSVCWRSNITGLEGRGTQVMSYQEASEWVRYANTKWPETTHWVCEAKEEEKT